MNIETEAVRLIPEDMCIDNCLLAFSSSENRIHIAVKGSIEKAIVDEIKFITGKEPVLYLCQENQIFAAIHKFFSSVNVKSALISLKNEYDSQGEMPQLMREKERNSENSPIVNLSRSIIIRAISMEASDIHMEPCADHVKVRFRIDGMLHEHMNMPREIYPMVCARIKVLAGIDVTEKRKPQDGKIAFNYSRAECDFRLATIPTLYGEKMVIRILNNRLNQTSLYELGFDKAGVKAIKEMLVQPYGILLVTGPTGSGKSTTLYSMLNSMDKLKKNIMTIEDPVEFSIEGVSQVNVCSRTGLDFPSG
jgi:type IV pilus assembly protein PilB